MDKAFIGSCRIGYGRISVQHPRFDASLDVFKRQPAQQGIIGDCEIGVPHRISVQIPTFDKIMNVHKKQSARFGGGKTPCVQGSAKQGMTRHRVKIPRFDEILQRQKEG